MNEVSGLKLIQAVDPTKIKVTINEKFSKLTLSSNKKKNLPAKTNDPVDIEKRRSASRNLMDELLDNDCNERIGSGQGILCSNAILRSSSLSSENQEGTKHTETLTQVYDMKTEDISVAAESMERLQMSEDLTHQHMNDEDELEELTQKVSGLAVDNVGGTVVQQENAAIIEIISSSEDEEELEEDEESVICISDTSVNSIVQDCFNDYNFMVVSDVQTSAQTDAPQLPCTLSNERADRIDAFLRDVSLEQRNMQATGALPDDSLLAHLTPSALEKANDDNALLESVKAKIIATADTESMSPTEIRSNPSNQRNIAFDDTEAMSESAHATLLPQNADITRNSNKEDKTIEDENSKRFANDDTEANTINNTLDESYHSSVEAIEDSIVIPETSSEHIDSSHNSTVESLAENREIVSSEDALSSSFHNTAESSPITLSVGSINISAKINIKLQIQARFSTSEDDSDESAGNSTPDIGKETEINDDNRESDDTDSNKKNESIHEDVVADSNPLRKMPGESNKTTTRNQGEIQSLGKTPIKVIAEDAENNLEEPDEKFLSHAQKLLTELYGNSWQTPEVIRTLQRTSAEAHNATKFNVNKNSQASQKTISQIEMNTSMLQHKQVEESVLNDFSIFRQNIVQTNLDSTRLTTPKTKAGKKTFPNAGFTEPKSFPKSDSKSFPKKQSNDDFKIPQTELKKKPANAVSSTKRPTNERWRSLVDTDSDSDQHNITDDVDVDQTVMTDDSDEEKSNASDSSWRNSEAELISEDEDNQVGRKNVKNSKNNSKSKGRNKKNTKNSSKDRLIYMDLSKDEVTILEDTPNCSPPADSDENFKKRLSKILSNCRYEDKSKMVATPTSTGKSKRRLFTVSYGDEIVDDSITAICRGETPKKKDANLIDDENSENVRLNGVPLPPAFNIFNKQLEAVKAGKPVFKITPTTIGKTPKTPIASREEGTPFRNKGQHVYQTPTGKEKRKLDDISSTPSFKYSFLKSLDVCVGKTLCHPDALVFRENYRQKKEDLAKILYELYNGKLFGNNLNVPIVWNKKLSNTAGRCLNKKKFGKRMSVIELSDKVLTSADRLRCTLIHELCHAATWIFDGEGGHGATWKEWARKANSVFPDLPKIGVCHQYDIEYKYTYKCTLCAAKSYYHSKSKKVENIRCSYCYGAIEIFLNKKDKDGNIMPTPVREPTGFAKFVKEKYQQYKRPDMKHAEVMKLLSNEFAALKVAGNAK